MDVLDLITLLIIMAALFLVVNVKYLRLPSTIGLMILALCLSLFIVLGEQVFSLLKSLATDIMSEYNFSDVLLNVMLSFLLFAGALEIDLRKLGEEKWPIFILATVGILISTFLVGTATYFILPLIGLNVEYIFCLLFGALISPTDPIAVLAMIKKNRVSKNLESLIAGESLFNDGIGVVVFLTILHIAGTKGGGFHIDETILLFFREVAGGIGLGAIIGYLGLLLLKKIDNQHTEIEVLVTLSMVLGGASVAEMLFVSGPLAMVTMGLFVGNKGRSKELASATGEYVYKFWHLLDEALNAILFILIGLQIIVITWELDYFLAAAIAIVVVLTARFFGVGIPLTLLRIRRELPQYTVRILTWSGLRGGISVALALYLYNPPSHGIDQDIYIADNIADLITAMTYSVVLFSIIVQGLTVGKLFHKYSEANPAID